jgi:hypothetical protein
MLWSFTSSCVAGVIGGDGPGDVFGSGAGDVVGSGAGALEPAQEKIRKAKVGINKIILIFLHLKI